MGAVAELRAALIALGTAERAAQERRYLKHDLEHLGVGNPGTRAVAKAWSLAHPEADLRDLAEACWATRTHELRSAALFVVEHQRRRLAPADLDWLVGLARTATTWAHVDHLAVHLVGPVVAGDPRGPERLRAWAADEAMWVRRTALLSPVLALRRGEADLSLFAELAAPRLHEREFFIRKAIGWVLREACRHHSDEVVAFVRAHAAEMSGLTFREATRKLPETARTALERARARGAGEHA